MNTNKLLGQHFLINKQIIEKICNSVEYTQEKVLEIGAGSGNLTEYLVNKFPNLIVLEKDPRCISILKQKYHNLLVDILQGDCLNFTYDNTFNTILGNLPYNIAQKLITKLLLTKNLFTMVFMLQKEVCEKFFNNTMIGCITYFNYHVEVVCNVSPHNFKPKPTVDSQVIKFTPKNKVYKNIDNILSKIKNLYEDPGKKLKNKCVLYGEYRIHQLTLQQIHDYLLV